MIGLAQVLKPMIPKMLKDTVNTHVVPMVDDFFYRDERLFDLYRQKGIIKPFFGASDAWTLPLLIEKERLQTGRPPQS